MLVTFQHFCFWRFRLFTALHFLIFSSIFEHGKQDRKRTETSAKRVTREGRRQVLRVALASPLFLSRSFASKNRKTVRYCQLPRYEITTFSCFILWPKVLHSCLLDRLEISGFFLVPSSCPLAPSFTSMKIHWTSVVVSLSSMADIGIDLRTGGWRK